MEGKFLKKGQWGGPGQRNEMRGGAGLCRERGVACMYTEANGGTPKAQTGSSIPPRQCVELGVCWEYNMQNSRNCFCCIPLVLSCCVFIIICI